MRETKLWMKSITREIAELCGKYDVFPQQLCQTELALTLVVSIDKGLTGKALPSLLSGYPFPALEQYEWNEAKVRYVHTGRHLLPFYLHPYP